MKSKKAIIGISAVAVAIVLLGIVVCVFPLFGQKDCLFVQDDDLYFGKPSLFLRMGKGKPAETSSSEISPTTVYYYTEEIGGYEVWSRYEFFRFGLTKAEYIFEDMDYSSALSITEEIANKQKEHYSSYVGYHCSDLQSSEEGTFSLTLGVTTTPEILSFTYTFDGEQLIIGALKHW